jgi:hypothetical protein
VFLPPRISGARPLPPSDYSQCGGAIIRHAAAQVPRARTASRHAAAQDLSVGGGRVRKSPQCLKLYCYRCHKAILCSLEFTCRPFARAVRLSSRLRALHRALPRRHPACHRLCRRYVRGTPRQDIGVARLPITRCDVEHEQAPLLRRCVAAAKQLQLVLHPSHLQRAKTGWHGGQHSWWHCRCQQQ